MSAPFVEVEFDLAQSLVGIGGVHLVGALVALQRAGRADRFAERAVEGRSVFRRVGHDLHVDEPFRVQRRADGADPAVHHVGGGDDVGAGVRLVERLPHQRRYGFVVEDRLARHEAVVAVARVGIERNVGDEPEARELLLDRAAGLAHQIVLIERLAAEVVLQARLGVGEKGDRRDFERDRALGRAHRLVDAERSTPGIAATGVRRRAPSMRNNGQIRSCGGQRVLSDQPSRPFRLAVATRTLRKLEA